MGDALRIGLTQTPSRADLAANLQTAGEVVERCAAEGCDLILLPENALYASSNADMAAHALTLDSEEIATVRGFAREAGVPLVLGGFKCRTHGVTVNRALVVDGQGEIAGWYDKIHGFNASVGGATYRAQATERAGDGPVVLDIGGFRLGLSICFDLRFPELHRALALAGADAILVPSAFTRATGRDHWESLLRARAIENGLYMLASATLGEPSWPDSDPRATYGHALAVDPWGHVLADLEETHPAFQIVTLSKPLIHEVRTRLPVLNQRAPAAYQRPAIVLDC